MSNNVEVSWKVKGVDTSIFLNVHRNDLKATLLSLKEIHKKLSDLNVPKLFRLTRENNDALD